MEQFLLKGTFFPEIFFILDLTPRSKPSNIGLKRWQTSAACFVKELRVA
jgi:hypothetical protein